MGALNPSRKKTLYNALMVIAILAIVGGVVAFAGSLRGWFSPGQSFEKAEYPSVEVVAQNKTGNVNIERAGLAYALENGNKIQDGDVIETLTGSSIELAYGDYVEDIGERREVLVHIDDDNKVGFEYINIRSADSDEVNAGVSQEANDPSIDGVAIGIGSSASSGGSGSTSDGASVNSGGSNKPAGSNKPTGSTDASGSGGVSSENSTSDVDPVGNYCTIAINCTTVLDNLENLAPGKDKYVPANGMILAPSRVEFKDGETVFDVLKRVCTAAGIQLEYSYTPLYESYYIEGINHLYEFDCGNESGWMFQVNGWYPNYGCSSYKIKSEDSIVWNYTCNGYGADLGASVN